MTKLTKAQLDGLSYMSRVAVRGPAPGWNASVEIEGVCDGEDLVVLFREKLITSEPAAPPHQEYFHEDAGSITCDHLYRLTPSGLAALQEQTK